MISSCTPRITTCYRVYFARFTTRQLILHRMCSSQSNAFSLFEGKEHAKLYAKYRPSYPIDLYDKIHRFCNETDLNKLDLAIDVGCGNGQSTLPLLKICNNVKGMDISTAQIEEAKRSPSNIAFRVGKTEDLSFLGDGTVDLVTTATAVHWMAIPTFMGEVSRVLRPGGVIAVYSVLDRKIHNEEAHRLIWEDFSKNTLRDCWTEKRVHIENGLSLVELPFKESEREDFVFEQKVAVDHYIGYLSTWSAWQTFVRKNPNTTALTDLQQRLTTLYTDSVTGELRQMSYTCPIVLLLGRKPQH